MNWIYYEITIYIYKAIFPLGAQPPNPRRGLACPWTPQPLDPAGAKIPPYNPPAWRGVQSSWGINTTENKDM